MTKNNEEKKVTPKSGGVKLGTSIKTATVEQLNTNFVTWDDLKDGQSIVFELNGEFKKTVSPKNKNHIFENYYTSKVVVVNSNEEVVKILTSEDNSIQIPCQQSHRRGINDLIEMGEKVCIFRDLKINVKDQNTYYNTNVGSLDLESLDAFEN